jgi:sulfite reductase (NADPH) flavoprotein alpha-component
VLSIPESAKGGVRIRYLSRDAPNERAFTEVQVDAKTGAVLKRDAYRDHTLGERIMAERLAVHRGSFFGLPGAILFALAAAAMPLFPITGWLLYLGRRRLKRNARLRGSLESKQRADLRYKDGLPIRRD